MVRIVLGAFVSAVIYFVWQMMTWMVLPLHGPTVAALPEESAVRDALIAQDLDSGVYIVPFGADPEDMNNPESEFMRRHRSGPIFSIYYQRQGAEPMSPSVLVTGFVTDFFATLIAAVMLQMAVGGCCCRSFVGRMGFVSLLGVFLALTGHIAYYNWMHFELNYTLMFVVDAVVGWSLVGVVLALIVRPAACQKQPESTETLEAT